MGVYSIKDLENFTRIKAHTLRIWEQRYGLLKPKRTDTNIRLYTEKDLKKILNINLLYTNGLKISKIALLSEQEIVQNANKILRISDGSEVKNLDCFITYIISFDAHSIEEELNKQYSELGMEKLFGEVLIPILKKIGELWQVDSISISHEHFFSNVLRKFLIIKTAALPEPKEYKGKAMLFLREGEYHEIGLLFYHYVLKTKGLNCLYIGQSLPVQDLKAALKKENPDYVFTSLIAKLDKEEFTAFFKQLAEMIALEKVFVGGYQLNIFEELIPKEVKVVHHVDTISKYIH